MDMFSDCQLRHWISMLDYIVNYWDGRVSFRSLVGGLERIWIEKELDRELSKQWDTLWFNLEMTNAVEIEGDTVSQKVKEDDVRNAYNFLCTELVKQMLSVIDAYQQDFSKFKFAELADYFEASLEFGKHLAIAEKWEELVIALSSVRYDWSEGENERVQIITQMKEYLRTAKVGDT